MINQIVIAILVVNVIAFIVLLNRNKSLLYAVMGTSLVIMLVLTVAKEFGGEWRDYQKEFIRMRIEKTRDPDALKQIKSAPIKIKQIWVPESGIADRCTTCHQAVNNPQFKGAPEPYRYHEAAREHDFGEIGCTSCHRGQGRATEAKAAHGRNIRHWEAPMWELDMIEISCPKCHKTQDLPGFRLSVEMTMEEYIKFGGRIFNSRGTCTLCHRAAGGAPNLRGVAKRAPKRIKDPRYKGKATTGEEYIRESIKDPSAFVVKGYGRKGTNDTISPMPDITKGVINLADVEINAVIAYLQSRDGVDVTMQLPSADELAAVIQPETEKPEIEVAEDAGAAFMKFDCATCHTHPQIEDGGDIGPDLTDIVKRARKIKKGMSAKEYIMESILDPNAFIADKENYEPDTMPKDFGQRMTVTEFNMIVNALLGVEGGKTVKR